MGEDGGNSWVTLDQRRTIVVDSSWIPKVIVHELIHAWKGKYAFSYTGESWSYEDDLSGFEEIAEGWLLRSITSALMAYPKDDLSITILEKTDPGGIGLPKRQFRFGQASEAL